MTVACTVIPALRAAIDSWNRWSDRVQLKENQAKIQVSGKGKQEATRGSWHRY